MVPAGEMTAGPVVRTEPLGGQALSRAARAGDLGAWYRAVPRGGSAWRVYADEVRESVPTNWYEHLAPALSTRGAAAERLARVAGREGARGIVVTTGQQPGLFGGPLYTLIKALSARALANELETVTGIPVAPIFWAATDDADFDEAAIVSMAGDDGVNDLRLTARAAAGTPMSRTLLRATDVEPLIDALRAGCGSAPHARYLDDAIQCYRDGDTVGGAYVALLRRLLEPLGIPVLDASHPAVAEAGRRTLLAAAHQAEAIAAALGERSTAIAGAGFAAQVDEVPGLSLVFARDGDVKRRLPIAEAATARAGAALSPTVLLRPVVERAIIPTAAYMGGPGEIAYFAQVTAVADALGVPAPLVLPRWSATIVEPRVQRVLDSFDMVSGDLADPHAAETRLARSRVPAGVAAALGDLRSEVHSAVDALRAANAEADGVINEAVIEGLRHILDHRVDRVERRVVAGVKRREVDALRRIAMARGSLFPHGGRQERALSFVPFLARYGPALLEQMGAAAATHARALIAGSPSLAPPSPSETASV